MRLKVRIRSVEPELYQMPTECPYERCHSKAFKQHQEECPKGLRHPQHERVEAKRRRCLRCGRSARLSSHRTPGSISTAGGVLTCVKHAGESVG